MALKLATDDLDERTSVFVEQYTQTGDAAQSALKAGYSHGNYGWRLLRSNRVQRALHDYRERLIKTEGATQAYQTLKELMKPGNSGTVRLGAAKVVMDMAGHTSKGGGGDGDKPMSEMTPDELRDLIAKLDKTIEGDFTVVQPDNAQESGTIPSLPSPDGAETLA